MMEFQDLDHIDGVSISTVSAIYTKSKRWFSYVLF
jgi:hypothetical protein